MTSFPIISNNGLSIAQGNWEFLSKRSNCLTNYRSWACSLSISSSYTSGSLFSRELNNHCSCKSQYPLICSTRIKPLINKGRKTYSLLEKKDNNDSRKKLSLRLQPKLKFLTSRLRRVSIRSVLSGLGTFIRKNISKVTISTCVSVVLGLCFLFLKVTSRPSPKVVPYSELVASIQNGVVSKVLFEEGTRRIYYNTDSDAQTSENEVSAPQPKVAEDDSGNSNAKNGRVGGSVWTKISKGQSSARTWQFSTRKIDHDEGFLLTLMREKGTSYGSAPQSFVTSMRSLLITVLTLWIPLTPLMWLLYRQLSAANSPAKKRKPSNQLIGFEDVEGVDTAKAELMEVVSCLQGAVNYSKLGAKLPRGVLLVGPPGTGKTLLARAVAGEAGVPFFSVSASEFVELFVGRGASRIRDLFKIARKNAPSIIFIDELDAVGGKRGRSFNDERDQTLNQLLTEMDGFESGTSIIIIGATNRPEALDQALCRPGRFSRKVYVGEPDEDGRKRILAVHFRGVPLEEDVDLICNLVASLTEGFVGADLANIVNEAALLAARRGGECVSREDVMEAVERAKFGIKDKSLRPSSLSRELGKLFPWVPSLIPRNDTRQDGPAGPLGYQTLS